MQSALELDVMAPEQLTAGDEIITKSLSSSLRDGKAKNARNVQACLYLRIANVGEMHGDVDESSSRARAQLYPHTIAPSFRSMQLSTTKAKAHRLIENEPQLAQAINRHHPDPSNEEAARKARRLEAIKSRRGGGGGGGGGLVGGSAHVLASSVSALPLTATIKPPDAIAPAPTTALDLEDLRTIEEYRTRHKREKIAGYLSKAITSEHVIHPTLGSAVYIEYHLVNPLSEDVAISVDFQDSDLHIITDVQEWRELVKLNNLTTAVEENMFHKEASGRHTVYLRAHEQVTVPFKFQAFHTRAAQEAPSDHHKLAQTKLLAAAQIGAEPERSVKVSFRKPDGHTLSVLNLIVRPQSFVVDQIFRFWQPQHTFLKQIIRIPPRLGSRRHLLSLAEGSLASWSHRIHLHCTDPNVVCDAKVFSPTEPQVCSGWKMGGRVGRDGDK